MRGPTKEEREDARRLSIEADGVVPSSGGGKRRKMTKDVFTYLRVAGRVISVLSPVL